MLAAVEKARKQLTSNDEIDVNIDPLMGDLEFETVLTRDQFQKMIDTSDIKPKLDALLEAANNHFRKEGIKIDRLELVGEATRMPYLNELVMDALGVSQALRTLNTQETNANGCAIIAMMCQDDSFFNYQLVG